MTHHRLIDKPKMGRELNHLEDLVLFYGTDGILTIIDILSDSNLHDVSIKWDGKVALYYGRDDDGKFCMGTKGNWAKNMPIYSAFDMFNYIMTTGNGEDFRPKMADDLSIIFPLLAESVPADFRGYIMGDLIFSPVQSPKKIEGDIINFTPNQVTYTARHSSSIGPRIYETSCGIASHVKYSIWNGKDAMTIDDNTVQQLNSPDVMVVGQCYVGHPTVGDLSALSIHTTNVSIDALISKRPGLSDISQILYTFVNQTIRAGGSEITPELFISWLADSKVSENKQTKLCDMYTASPDIFAALFEVYTSVIAIKHSIIDQLDNMAADITASINGLPGGEGYVSLANKIKLVPRTRWRLS